ncbi:MAG TPA: hypothetical protein VL992_18470 [Tepidisphaeraceae bacterium]|nr:hypothetical protein [Tepidisphaeraceae bacterium]
MNDKLFFIGGARAFHLSNAGIDRGRNPSINEAVQGYLGLGFKF